MSVVTNEAGKAARGVAGVTGSVALLPYTGNNEVALVVAIIALIASTAVLTAAILKRLIVRA